ncbi:RNA polymerase sigma factor [Actinacidiphila epipremni]|uniref:RNA polymerase sigma factor n=1 Tax=Actinacidiphila epipremni TaxID=2053013 RepID=UPI002B003A1D|nr:sigma-70 family RNA polymerase sigma factor [Actinacidiphila epipremni]
MNVTARRRGDPESGSAGEADAPGEKGRVGDLAELEAFYRRHVEDVTRFVGRRFDDPHTVADVVADIFLAVVDSGEAYRTAARDERSWLYGVARHVVSAEYRRKHRADVLNSRIAGRRLLGPDDIGRVEDRIVAENAGRTMVAAMSWLPARQRAVLELVAVDELTVAEAARALGVSSVTARVTLHRARAALRKAAEPPAGEPVPALDAAAPGALGARLAASAAATATAAPAALAATPASVPASAAGPGAGKRTDPAVSIDLSGSTA